jgi:hypothetical protein
MEMTVPAPQRSIVMPLDHYVTLTSPLLESDVRY